MNKKTLKTPATLSILAIASFMAACSENTSTAGATEEANGYSGNGSYTLLKSIEKNEESTIPFLWFAIDDKADGGESSIEWSAFNDSSNVLELLMNQDGYISGTAHFAAGENDRPYVGIGHSHIFRMADRKRYATFHMRNASEVCVTYSSDVSIDMVLAVNDSLDEVLGHDLYKINLPKNQQDPDIYCSDMSEFKPSKDLSKKISRENYLNSVESVNFIIYGKDDETAKFKIMDIQWKIDHED